jgi:hypothetical protein
LNSILKGGEYEFVRGPPTYTSYRNIPSDSPLSHHTQPPAFAFSVGGKLIL